MTDVKKNPHLQKAFALSNQKDCKELYKDWAETYDDTMLGELKYSAPDTLAKFFTSHFEKRDARIIDFGCGTGLVGESLKEIGFNNVDGADFSEEMLAVSKDKSCYRQLLLSDLSKTLDIETDTYDAGICAGLFTLGHLDAECMDEFIRIIRPGGAFASAIRAQVWQDMGFAEKISGFEKSKRVEVTKTEYMPNYEGSKDNDGMFIMMQIN